jgi:hypothetical protein
LLPPDASADWARAVINATWDQHKWTVGSSADDAGIGDLDHRYVVAVNPGLWPTDLGSFFAQHYPGVTYLEIEATSPDGLEMHLRDIELPLPNTTTAHAQRGTPRVQYKRTYVLLPPDADARWARRVVNLTWDAHHWTIGSSADDAGIGRLDERLVLAVNPEEWPTDLRRFFEEHYPGVQYAGVEAPTVAALSERLRV